MRKTMTVLAATAALFSAGAASAQDSISSSFKGFRLEANAGGDRFQSQGTHDDSFGYGAEGGWDGEINGIVVGPYASYWKSKGENFTTGTGGSGVVSHRSFQEIGIGARVGYQVTPAILVFGQGGYVNNEQRKAFSGNNAAGRGRYYDHFKTDGYQVGGGVEYSLLKNVYLKAAYKYSNYQDHTARQQVLGGAGVRF